MDNTLRKAAEMAIEAMERRNAVNDEYKVYLQDAIETLRQALAQPEQEHKPWCDYLNIMLTSLPPQRAKCNCKQVQPWDTSDMAHRAGGLSMDQEPVAWEKSYDIACALLRQAHDILAMTQYPIKRPWVSLTEEESSDIYNAHHNTYGECITSAHDLVLDIEAKLREKNT